MRSSEDRRSITVELTPKTAETKAIYEDVSSAMTELFYRGLSDGEVEGFEHTLARVLANLEE